MDDDDGEFDITTCYFTAFDLPDGATITYDLLISSVVQFMEGYLEKVHYNEIYTEKEGKEWDKVLYILQERCVVPENRGNLLLGLFEEDEHERRQERFGVCGRCYEYPVCTCHSDYSWCQLCDITEWCPCRMSGRDWLHVMEWEE
jgi:hypothetical protein